MTRRESVVTGSLLVGILGRAVISGATPISVTYTDPVTSWEWAETREVSGFS
jgi:hypothetical protein